MVKKEILYPVTKENSYYDRDWIEKEGKEKIEHKKGEVSVAKGSLEYYPFNDTNLEWVKNKVFEETLEYIGYSRGRSSATFQFKDSTGADYSIFMKDMNDLLMTKDIINGEIKGFWTYCKRGKNFGIRLATEKEMQRVLED